MTVGTSRSGLKAVRVEPQCKISAGCVRINKRHSSLVHRQAGGEHKEVVTFEIDTVSRPFMKIKAGSTLVPDCPEWFLSCGSSLQALEISLPPRQNSVP